MGILNLPVTGATQTIRCSQQLRTKVTLRTDDIAYALDPPTTINERDRYRLARARPEPPPGTELMGILNDIWWLLGFLMAAPLVVPGVENVIDGSYPMGALLLALGTVVLFLPEYLRWRLLGGNSPFERVPLIGARADQGEE